MLKFPVVSQWTPQLNTRILSLNKLFSRSFEQNKFMEKHLKYYSKITIVRGNNYILIDMNFRYQGEKCDTVPSV